MPSFSTLRSYNLSGPQIDLITYCVNQHLKEFSPQEDNEARKIIAEINGGGNPMYPLYDESSDPYANICDI